MKSKHPIPKKFQSTLPARGATLQKISTGKMELISIHAPRTGSDATMRKLSRGVPNFNPRSPHGERHMAGINTPDDITFQSTLPARGATGGRCLREGKENISIHAPRTGSDLLAPINGVLDDVNHLLVDASVLALCKDLQLAMKPRAHSQCDFPAICRHCAVISLLLYSAVTLLSRCCRNFFEGGDSLAVRPPEVYAPHRQADA